MKHILLIDDDAYALRLYVKALQANGCVVESVGNVDDALSRVERFQYDCIVVDLMMPPGALNDSLTTQGGFQTGMHLVHPLKQLNPNAAIVGLSNAFDDEAQTWFRQLGNGFFQKQETPPILFAQHIMRILGMTTSKPRAFIVHGHDKQLLLELKNFLQNRLKFEEPVILAEQPSRGRTIIEKFEKHAKDIDCAFAIFTPDDFSSNGGPARARQNVIFELGYFLGVLGRRTGRVFVLVKGGIEIPSDLQGVVYIDVSDGIEAAAERIRAEVETILKWHQL